MRSSAPAGPTSAPLAAALPRSYARPPRADALRPDPATVALVRDQVRALLLATPSFHELRVPRRRRLAHDLVKVAAYAAECVRDDWYQSEHRLGQRPLVVRSSEVAAPVAEAQDDQRPGADFVPGAARQIGRVTRQTLDAIAFPTFVAELIRGTFDAITQSSIKQMEAYGRLLGDVGRTVDDFMNQNISDNQTRDWLVESYPEHLRVVREAAATPAPQRPGAKPSKAPRPSGGDGGAEARLAGVEGADARPLPNWRRDLGVTGSPSLDGSWLEDKLVPAARRKLAQNRLTTLSTMVLQGMNRITVTGGKLRATMAFHIDTSDFAREERATDLDIRTAAAGGVNYGIWAASGSASFAYVTSSRNFSESEMNVGADLTSEVEIHFRSDAFPLERMAPPAALGQMVANTANPATNTPTSSSGAPIPWGETAVARVTMPTRTRPEAKLRADGIPTAPAPAAPAGQPALPKLDPPPELAVLDPAKAEPPPAGGQVVPPPAGGQVVPPPAGGQVADQSKTEKKVG